MLTRRHLRIKCLQILYAFFIKEERDLPKAERELDLSISKVFLMYLHLYSLLGEMQRCAIEKIDNGMNKKMPSKEDLHPNTKFVTNYHIRTIANSKMLANAYDKHGIDWSEHKSDLKKMFNQLCETEDYKEYMESSDRGFDHDREFALRFFKRHLINMEFVSDFFEEKSIFWNDDLDLMSGMVIKSIKMMEEKAGEVHMLELWKDEEDESGFMRVIFRDTIMMSEENENTIAEFALNWDKERIATIDMILMKMALAEARSFPQIPLKVTLNEYIELSKYYSLPQSSGFINGVLDQAFDKLVKDKVIKKIGRGLIQE